MLQRGNFPTLSMVYLPPRGHCGNSRPLIYSAISASTTGVPGPALLSAAHCFLAPSIWRRLFIHALRKELDEGPQATKFGMTIAKAPIATTENITTRHQNRLRFFGDTVISI